jgi:hypothetical protein
MSSNSLLAALRTAEKAVEHTLRCHGRTSAEYLRAVQELGQLVHACIDASVLHG